MTRACRGPSWGVAGTNEPGLWGVAGTRGGPGCAAARRWGDPAATGACDRAGPAGAAARAARVACDGACRRGALSVRRADRRGAGLGARRCRASRRVRSRGLRRGGGDRRRRRAAARRRCRPCYRFFHCRSRFGSRGSRGKSKAEAGRPCGAAGMQRGVLRVLLQL